MKYTRYSNPDHPLVKDFINRLGVSESTYYRWVTRDKVSFPLSLSEARNARFRRYFELTPKTISDRQGTRRIANRRGRLCQTGSGEFTRSTSTQWRNEYVDPLVGEHLLHKRFKKPTVVKAGGVFTFRVSPESVAVLKQTYEETINITALIKSFIDQEWVAPSKKPTMTILVNESKLARRISLRLNAEEAEKLTQLALRKNLSAAEVIRQGLFLG